MDAPHRGPHRLPTTRGLWDKLGGLKPHPSIPSPGPSRSQRLRGQSLQPWDAATAHGQVPPLQQKNPTRPAVQERGGNPGSPGPGGGQGEPAHSPQQLPGRGFETRQLFLLNILLSPLVLLRQQLWTGRSSFMHASRAELPKPDAGQAAGHCLLCPHSPGKQLPPSSGLLAEGGGGVGYQETGDPGQK